MSDPLASEALIATLVYTGVGVGVFLLAFFIISKMLPFSLRKEIEEDQNVALGVVIGAVILGLAHIIAAVVGAS
jgi:uncharacterized membrane protein YjfL (UPF0719 family)